MRRRPSSRYRLVVLAAVFLAAGVVVNVGVAWTAAGPWRARAGALGWRKELLEGEWPDTPPDGWPRMAQAYVTKSWCLNGFVGGCEHAQIRGARISNSGVVEHWMTVTDCGWPMRALTKTQVWPEDTTMGTVRTGILLSPAGQKVLLPIWPLPLGFAVNTVFFAVPLGLLAAGRVAFVRARRRRKGLCVACAYSRSGLGVDAPCPECGKTP